MESLLNRVAYIWRGYIQQWYKVENGTDLENKLMEYKRNQDSWRKVIMDFKSEFNIQANCILLSNCFIGIIPTDADRYNFGIGRKLTNQNGCGDLHYFKSNTKIGRRWQEILRSTQLSIPSLSINEFHITKAIHWDATYKIGDTYYIFVVYHATVKNPKAVLGTKKINIEGIGQENIDKLNTQEIRTLEYINL